MAFPLAPPLRVVAALRGIRSPVTALANSGKRRALRRTPGMPERYAPSLG